MRTAEEFWLETSKEEDIYKGLIKPDSCSKFMIAFARMHVKKALKEAVEASDCHSDSNDILSCYPIENIK